MIQLNGIGKEYPIGDKQLTVLKDVDLSIKSGEFVAVMGSSGSGKSTLFHIIGCLDRATSGDYFFDGIHINDSGDKTLSLLRAKSLGFIFQTFNLIPFLTLLENVELPFLYADHDMAYARKQAVSAIQKVGLAGRMMHRPCELSGGEMQRGAIARAIAVQPRLILADEPTGNLDSKTEGEVLQILSDLHAEGTTLLMVTHDPRVSSWAQRIIQIQDGSVYS